VQIQAEEILRLRKRLNNILAKHTGQPMKRIERDTERDFFMDSDEAREYGLIDEVIQPIESRTQESSEEE